jgi:superfamily I DNA and/or RNA helicase
MLTFDPLQFVKDKRRATVALSRAKAGLFIHGNLRTMAMGETWRKFFCAALERTHVVDPREFASKCHKPNQRFGSIDLVFPEVTDRPETEHTPEGPELM